MGKDWRIGCKNEDGMLDQLTRQDRRNRVTRDHSERRMVIGETSEDWQRRVSLIVEKGWCLSAYMPALLRVLCWVQQLKKPHIPSTHPQLGPNQLSQTQPNLVWPNPTYPNPTHKQDYYTSAPLSASQTPCLGLCFGCTEVIPRHWFNTKYKQTFIS